MSPCAIYIEPVVAEVLDQFVISRAEVDELFEPKQYLSQCWVAFVMAHVLYSYFFNFFNKFLILIICYIKFDFHREIYPTLRNRPDITLVSPEKCHYPDQSHESRNYLESRFRSGGSMLIYPLMR